MQKNSLFYTIASMVTKASTFLLLFIYINPDFLSTEDYGRVNLRTSFTNIAVLLVNLSLPYALIRFYAEYRLDKEKCKKFFVTIMTFMALFGAAVVALMIVFRNPISGILFKGIEVYPSVICTLSTLVFAFYGIIDMFRQGMMSFSIDGEMLSKILLVAASSVTGFVPINVLYVGMENEIELFSGMFFINFVFKFVVFAVGVICIIGRKRKEMLSLIKGIVKKKL